MTDQTPEHVISKYRYEVLFGAWLLITGGTFLRISRQPYSSRLKIEQYESIFKGTSLSAVLLGMGGLAKKAHAISTSIWHAHCPVATVKGSLWTSLGRGAKPSSLASPQSRKLHMQASSNLAASHTQTTFTPTMRIGSGSWSFDLNMWNPVYALAPFVLLMVSIPLAIFAVITTSIAVMILAARVFVVYIQLTVALIGAYFSPATNPTTQKPITPSRQQPLTTSPGDMSPNRERRHRNKIISSTSSQETIVPAARSTYPANNSGSLNAFSRPNEATRDFEGVGGWRAPGDEDEEALWMGMNSRLQLPTDAPRRYSRSLSGATSPGLRISTSTEAIRMSPVHSRARTPVRFAVGNEDDYFPPQPPPVGYAASNTSEPKSNHKRRKSASSSSSTSSGLTMTAKEAGE